MPTMEEILMDRADRNHFPIRVNLELTPLCNMNCRMCYIKRSAEDAIGMHTAEEWLRLAEELKEVGVLYLLLTGGEPLLLPGFAALYQEIYRMGFMITVNTNGTLITPELAQLWGRMKPRRVNITVYGASNETYSEVCGNSHGYDQVIRGIKLLLQEGVPVKLNGTMIRKNAKDAMSILDLADSYGVPVKLDTYMYPFRRSTDIEEKNIGEWERSVCESRLQPEEAAALELAIRRRQLGEEAFALYCGNVIMSREEAERNTAQGASGTCRAGISSGWIAWTGQLSPCVFMDEPSVNAFDGFWNAWLQIRERINESPAEDICRSCVNRNHCQVCRAAILSDMSDDRGVPRYLCEYAEYYWHLIQQEYCKR